MGLESDEPPHIPADFNRDRAGRVELWQPLPVGKALDADAEDEGAAEGDDGDEGAGPRDTSAAASDPASLRLSRAIADEVQDWIAQRQGRAHRRAGRHPDPRPPPPRSRGADRRAVAVAARAGRGGRPLFADAVAGGAGSARGDALCGAAARRPQSRQPAGVAAVRLEPGRSVRALPMAARNGRCGSNCAHAKKKRRPKRWRRCAACSAWAISRRRSGFWSASCPGRSTGGASCISGWGARRATRSTNCWRRRWRSSGRKRRRCSASCRTSPRAPPRSSARARRAAMSCA